MRQGISTHVFLQQRLTPVLLDHLAMAGASVIEVFASRHHFDYTDRAAVAEIAAWFGSNPVAASLHMPLFDEESEALWTRHTAPALNLISLNKSTRIETMDETKRALEAAEQIPLESCVIHLGLKDDHWDTRALDDSLTAVEHLKAFSGPLGVRLLLEGLPNDVATPQHLVEIVSVGHFSNVGFCLDLGHAHLGQSMPQTKDKAARSGIELSFAAFAPEAGRVGSVHLHDNHGVRDEHLWPGDGSIDWPEAVECMKSLPPQTVGILEIAHELGSDPGTVVDRAQAAWRSLQLPSA